MKLFENFNPNLVWLKCVLFLFFGGLGSVLPFLPLHMSTIGLSRDEATLISAISPLIAMLGPLVGAPLADRLAIQSKTGRYLRLMIAGCMLLATIFYWLLIAIPPIYRSPPNVSFVCDPSGGYILQDRCNNDHSCSQWNGERGIVRVKNCIFTCNATTSYRSELPGDLLDELVVSGESSTDEYYDDATIYPEGDPAPLHIYEDTSRTVTVSSSQLGIIPHPHMCYNDYSKSDSPPETVCQVYTEHSEVLDFELALKQAPGTNNATEEEVCRYQFDGYFKCRISPETKQELTANNADCSPVVLCEVHEPYNNTRSLLRRSQCGYDNISFWLYLVTRSLTDLFTATAVTLLISAVVVATRETSTGRADIGKQLAFGALGFAIFAPIVDAVAEIVFVFALVVFSVLMLLAIFVILIDNKTPLSPPEWWWYTKCGLLALPMSSVRRYSLEVSALAMVLLILGVFWNAIDAFLPWHLVHLPYEFPVIIGMTITMGAAPAFVLYFFAERIVDYCGHTNILILCFVNYIIHHIALILIQTATALLIFEALEVCTLHLMWITAILYMRHLMPRKYTTCAQALPIVMHFCLGRSIGSILGSLAYSKYPGNFKSVHQYFAIAATLIAIIYFLTFHFYLKQKCAAPMQLPPSPAPPVVHNNMNGNGTYTPLRVYHNGRAKKGHFRY